MSNLLATLRRQLDEGVARLDSISGSVMRRRDDLAASLERRVEELEEVREHRAIASAEEIAARVQELVAARQFQQLTSREARVAARMLAALGPDQVWKLLHERPETWPTFVDEIFRNWDGLDALPTRSEFEHVAMQAPASIPTLSTSSRKSVLARTGPRWLAEQCARQTLGETAAHVASIGFKPRWAFTAHALAHAAAIIGHRRGYDHVWSELERTAPLANTLLPPLTRAKGTWFFAQGEGQPSGSVAARAIFAAQVLRAMLAPRKPAFADRFGAALLDSDFGDPRIPPEGYGWRLIRHFDAQAHARFIEGLIREDLTLFFDHAMNEPERRVFWLRYLGSIRRTICVLGKGMYKELGRRLAGATEDVRAALGRVRQFSAHQGVSAFCLYFDDIVVVEFSDSGNAAYVYRRRDFDEQIEAALMKNELRAHGQLKHDMHIHRIRHHRGWQGDAHDFLVRHGVSRR